MPEGQGGRQGKGLLAPPCYSLAWAWSSAAGLVTRADPACPTVCPQGQESEPGLALEQKH